MPEVIIPEELHCFKYHYPVGFPVQYVANGTLMFLETHYRSTGMCKEEKVNF